MDWSLELLFVVRAIGAAVLGALIGWEREYHGREAGIRTYASVSLGACVFGLISAHLGSSTDPSRVAAQVVTGAGFLGAGVILREQGRVAGSQPPQLCGPRLQWGLLLPSECTFWDRLLR